MTPCPKSEQLDALVAERLGDNDRITVEEHVETCADCQTVLERLCSVATQAAATVESGASGRSKEAASSWNENLVDRCMDALRRGLDEDDDTRPTARGVLFPEIPGYTVKNLIGRGGMGAVYKAIHQRLRRVVALKVLPADRLGDQSARARFDREMQAVGKLNHPNIVVAHDAGEADGNLYLAMELVEGLDLATLLLRSGPLRVADACEIIRQAAVGLAHAHRRNMVHRDLKPSNLMLAESEDGPPLVKLLDLGLALLGEQHQAGQGLTTTGQMMGTLEYMAPEQGLDSHEVDIRADIYSLGATLYKLLCGETPYPASKYDTPLKMMRALATETPASLGEKRVLPKELVQLVARMLARDPNDRPASPQDVANALAPYAAGNDLTALFTRVRRHTAMPLADPSEATSELNHSAGVDTWPTDAGRQGDQAARAGEHSAEQHSTGAKNSTAVRALRTSASARLLALGGGIGLIALLAALVLYLQTPNGTLRVEINDPSIEVLVKGTDIVLKKADKEEVTLTPGEHALTVKRGDFSFDTSSLELKKGKTTTVKVDLLPGKVQVVSAGQVIGQAEIATLAKPPDDVNLGRLPEFGGTAELSPSAGDGYPGKFALWFPEAFESRVEVPTLEQDFFVDKPFTMELWVRRDPKSERAHRQIMGYTDMLNVATDADGHSFVFGGAGTRIIGSESRGEENEFAWTHVAIVRDKENTLRLFRDGRQTAMSERDPKRIFVDERMFQFAGRFSGTLGEARVSSVARYDKDFAPQFGLQSDADTIALYHFDEGSGNVLKDSSGNKHHGKIVGAKWVRVASPDRAAAEWALSIGGHVEVVVAPDQRKRITALNELPNEPFKLVVCDLSNWRAVVREEKTDAGLACFEGCVDLEELSLNGWPLREGMEHFRNCQNLTVLQLYQSGISDDGLAHFKNNPRLKHLNVVGSRVSEDVFTEFLRGRQLDIVCVPPSATDACIDALIGVKPTYLGLQMSKITANGRKRLAVALPQCGIEW